MMCAIEVRPLTTMADIKPVEEIQMQAWGRDPMQVIPAHVLKAAQNNGNALLGAFDGDTIVGYSYGILALRPNVNLGADGRPRLYMYSHQLAVLPSHQGQGIGRLLKLAQRETAVELGINLMTWTYDPLMSRNGWLNIGRLGGIVRTYLENYYGDLDPVASDRFYIEWRLTSQHVEARLAGEMHSVKLRESLASGAVILNPGEMGEDGFIRPPDFIVNSHGEPTLLVEIPSDFNAVVAHDYGLGMAWREQTRRLFIQLFDSGYCVTNFVKQSNPSGQMRCFYLLNRE